MTSSRALSNHHCNLPDYDWMQVGIILKCPHCGAYWRSYLAEGGTVASFRKLGVFEVERLKKLGRITE